MIGVARALILICALIAGAIIMGGISAIVSPASWWIADAIGDNFGSAGLIAFLVGGFALLIYSNIRASNIQDREQVAKTGTLDLQRNVSSMSREEWWRSAAILATPAVILAVIVAVYLLTKVPPT